jgi:hypothetical protein
VTLPGIVPPSVAAGAHLLITTLPAYSHEINSRITVFRCTGPGILTCYPPAVRLAMEAPQSASAPSSRQSRQAGRRFGGHRGSDQADLLDFAGFPVSEE